MESVYRLENDGTGVRTQDARVRVRTDAGLAPLGRLVFAYDSTIERLTVDVVEVIKPDGRVVQPGPDASNDVTPEALAASALYSGHRQRHVVVAGLAVNDLLHYRVTVRSVRALLPGHFWLGVRLMKDTPVTTERVTIDVPAARDVRLKTSPDAAPVVAEGEVSDGRRVFRWSCSNPTPRDASVVLADAVAGRLPPPEIRLSTFSSWSEVARSYLQVTAGRSAVDETIRAKALELTRGLATPRAKLEALYTYVTTECRYVSLSFGQGLIVPHAAAEVLRNLHGDCKDRHVLLAALAAAVGIETYGALLSVSTTIDPELPSMGQFDHVITVAPLGPDPADWLWMDTTSLAPAGLLNPRLRGKQALLLVAPAKGTGRAVGGPAMRAELTTIPDALPFTFLSRTEIDGRVDSTGTLDADVKLTARGDAEVLLRQVLRTVPADTYADVLKPAAQQLHLSDDLTNVSVSSATALDAPFTMGFRSRQTNWLARSAKPTVLSIPFPAAILSATAEADWKAGESTTILAMVRQSARVVIDFPAGYLIRIPVGVTVTRDYAEYRATYRLEGQRLIAERLLTPLKTDLPRDRQRDYLAFVAAVRADESQSLTIDTSAAPAAAGGAVPPAELYATALRHFRAKEYQKAVDLWRQLVAVEPTHKDAWDALGLAYEKLGKDTDAEAALREQTRLEPFHGQAWTDLGMILEKQKRFPEAEAAYRRQLEVTPLGKAAHRKLGLMLFSQQRYKDAEPVLSRSSELEPDNVDIASALGRARVKLADVAGAIAAFEQAMRLDAWPGVMAEFALDLAEENIGLDRAAEWAKTAMQKAAADSLAFVNGSVDKSTPHKSRALSWAWFAHGWIAFRRGDFATAERYLLAARAVRKAPAIQDHLGQVYDRLGRPTDAAKYYGESLAIAPNADTRRRLLQIVKTEAVADDVVEGARMLLVTERIIGSLGQNRFPDTGALLVLVFTNGTPGPETHWLSGSEDLKALLPAVRSATYPVRFPDASAARLAVPGMLGCPPVQSTCGLMIGEPIPLPPGMRGSK